MNIFKFDFRFFFYIKHPINFLKELVWNIRSAKDRIKKGYCDTDWMNFDVWFKNIASDMLKDMAQYGHAYPGSEPFDTPEKWNAWLNKMSEQLLICTDDDIDNEYYQPYLDELTKNIENNPELEELREKYLNRSKQIMVQHKILFKKTMNELIEHWDSLWD